MEEIFRDVTGLLSGLPGFQVKSVARDGRTLCEGAKGARFLGSEDTSEVDANTVFWVASCTKIVTAIALMQCVERGQVTLDAIPTDILPELKDLQLLLGWTEDDKPILTTPGRYPTVRELLSHQSGTSVDISELAMMKWNKYLGRKTNSQTGNIKDLQYPMLFNPGEGWMYSVGMDWVGHLISRLNANISLADYFEANIFQPLGLKDTTFQPLDDSRFSSRLTGTHWRRADGLLYLAEENVGNNYARSGNHNAGGGLWSTANDLCRLLQAVFLDENCSGILQPTSAEEILTPCLKDPSTMEATVARMTAAQDLNLNILPQIPVNCPKNMGLGVAINLETLDTGLSAGGGQWSGFPNCYWWVDRTKGAVGAMVSSILTFNDPLAFPAYRAFQTASYEKLLADD